MEFFGFSDEPATLLSIGIPLGNKKFDIMVNFFLNPNTIGRISHMHHDCLNKARVFRVFKLTLYIPGLKLYAMFYRVVTHFGIGKPKFDKENLAAKIRLANIWQHNFKVRHYSL